MLPPPPFYKVKEVCMDVKKQQHCTVPTCWADFIQMQVKFLDGIEFLRVSES